MHPHSPLPTIARPLGALEKLFWLADQTRPNHFVMAAEIAGSITRQQWQDAASAMAETTPRTLAAIVRDPQGRPVFLPGAAHGLPVRFIPGQTDAWQRYASLELAQPFLTGAGPLLRLTVLEDRSRCVVLVAAHHSIADGRSLVAWLQALLARVAGAPTDLRELGPSMEDATRTPGDVPARASAQPLPPPLHVRPDDGETPSVCTASLTREETAMLRAASVSNGASVHGAICAALASIAGPSAGAAEQALHIMSPIDLRSRLLPTSASLGLAIMATVTRDQSDLPFWERARGFTNSCREAVDPGALAAGIGQVEHLMHAIDTPAEAIALLGAAFPAEIMVTNLGETPGSSTVGAIEVEAVWGPMLSLGFAGQMWSASAPMMASCGSLKQATSLFRASCSRRCGNWSGKADQATDEE